MREYQCDHEYGRGQDRKDRRSLNSRDEKEEDDGDEYGGEGAGDRDGAHDDAVVADGDEEGGKKANGCILSNELAQEEGEDRIAYDLPGAGKNESSGLVIESR